MPVERPPRERRPAGQQAAERVWDRTEKVQQDPRTGASLWIAADQDALHLRIENIREAMKPGVRYSLFYALRGPAETSGLDNPPRPADFRWNLLTANPLPADQVNANPNTVLVVPLSRHETSSAVEAYSALFHPGTWVQPAFHTLVTSQFSGSDAELALPWHVLDPEARRPGQNRWADVLVFLYNEDTSEIVTVFPSENGIGPRVLLSYTLSFAYDAAAGPGGRWVNTAATDFPSVLVDEAFGALDERWREIRFPGAGNVAGEARAEDALVLSARGSAGYGVYLSTPLEGTFDVQLQGRLLEGTAAGLALFKDVGGRPDPASGVRVERTRDEQGRDVVRAFAQRNGESMAEEWYQTTVPFFEYRLGDDEFGTEALGFRVQKDERASCLRFAYKYRRRVDGLDLEGWMEFPTVADWDKRGWYVCPYVRSAADIPALARFERLLVANTRRDEPIEETAGFGARRRTYTFSGVSGDALVVSFGREAPFNRTAKFVFWREANYMPWWHIDDKCAVAYQSVETWDGGTTWKGATPGGCCEPMSDRLLRWSTVDVLETNDARVVVRWQYVLANPEYQWWGLDPARRPFVEESYCFYPDGNGVRTITYRPVTGTPYETKWNEISELLMIHRGGVLPSECLSRTALSMGNLQGVVTNYTYLTNPSQYIGDPVNSWDEAIIRLNLNHRPAPFMAVAQGASVYRRTFPAPYDDWWGHFDNTWHAERQGGYEYEGDFWPFSHWPISRIPYEEHTKSNSRFVREPGHTSIMGVPGHPGATEPTTWAVLIGLGEPGDSEGPRRRVSSWLYPGEVKTLTEQCRFVENDVYRRALVFECDVPAAPCRFTLKPHPVCVNPVLSIRNWGQSPPVVSLDGKPLPPEQYRWAVADRELVLWISTTVWSNTTFGIEPAPTALAAARP